MAEDRYGYINRRLDEIQARFTGVVEEARTLIKQLLHEGIRTPSVTTSEWAGVTFSWHVNGWDAELEVRFKEDQEYGPMLWARKRGAHDFEEVPMSSERGQQILALLRHPSGR